MKSFVSQGKNILDAINSALILAQFPQYFTIKILEREKRSFFWWHNKPAVILFSFRIFEEIVNNQKKKSSKKNYSKEDAFSNKKVFNHFDEAEYTSTIKNEKDIIKKDTIKSEREKKFTINDAFGKGFKPQSYKIKEKLDTKLDTINSDSSEKEIISKMVPKTINQPQSLLGAALQNKKHSDDEYVYINKKNLVKDLEPILDKKNIDLKSIHSEGIMSEVDKDYILFVENWINELNKNFNFTNDLIKVSLVEETLCIKIDNFCNFEFVSKKHLYSSIVILLYEHLKINFIKFDNKFYKIIIE